MGCSRMEGTCCKVGDQRGGAQGWRAGGGVRADPRTTGRQVSSGLGGMGDGEQISPKTQFQRVLRMQLPTITISQYGYRTFQFSQEASCSSVLSPPSRLLATMDLFCPYSFTFSEHRILGLDRTYNVWHVVFGTGLLYSAKRTRDVSVLVCRSKATSFSLLSGTPWCRLQGITADL